MHPSKKMMHSNGYGKSIRCPMSTNQATSDTDNCGERWSNG